MELFSFIGISILVLDILFISLFLVTLYLGVAHIFNDSYGTEFDLFISFVLLGVIIVYNYLVNVFFNFLWNRNIELLIIFIVNLIIILFLNLLFKGSEKKGGNEHNE